MTRRSLLFLVTPTLNQGLVVEQTLHSIERQTYRAFENIVVGIALTDAMLDNQGREHPARSRAPND